MPPRMKVLYISSSQRTGAWLAEAFAADSATKVVLEEAMGTADGVGRLREEVFDAVLVSHQPGELDALELIEGYRAGGAEVPILVLGATTSRKWRCLCYEVRADGYVDVRNATTRNLIWLVVRAVERHQLIRENQRFSQAEQGRRQRQRDEARRLLEEQRSLSRRSKWTLRRLPATGRLPRFRPSWCPTIGSC